MKIVIGLGNPGSKYQRTRHNAGFDVIDILCEKWQVRLNKVRHKAVYGECRVNGERVLIAKPQTYMNLSGESIVSFMRFYKAQAKDIVIIYDDVDLPFGRIRVRPHGSAGTHNGMRSIIGLTGDEGFPRVRVGMGRGDNPNVELKDFVLKGYSKQEQQTAFDALMRAAQAVECIMLEGVDAAMAKYNAK